MDNASDTRVSLNTSLPNCNTNRRTKQMLKLLCRSCSCHTAIPRRQILLCLWVVTMIAAMVSLTSSSWWSTTSPILLRPPPPPSSYSPLAPLKTGMSSGNASLPSDRHHNLLGKYSQLLPSNSGSPSSSPYHDWLLFSADFSEMLNNLKIFVYPHVSMNHSSPLAPIFLPHPDPFDPKLGNYFSEHMFKISLLQSSLLTSRPEEAHFFFMPFSINSLRNYPQVHSESSIADFVSQYTISITRDFHYWNASRGSDHFYVCCHSVGRNAASNHHQLHNNAIQVACSSSYFQRLYVAHKDVGLPQVWPRPHHHQITLNRRDAIARTRLVFFAGRIQNSRVRQELINSWENDSYMDIFSGRPPFPYEEGFKRSKYCLHVKGYEVNTARISDAMQFGCIPVIISNYYDLPFANVLNWSTFSIIISYGEITFLKQILTSISGKVYLRMYDNLRKVRRHFKWHTTPRGYDAFHMTAYQLWLRRGIHRLT